MMRKRSILISLILVLALVVTACGGGSGSTGEAPKDVVKLKMSVTASETSTWYKGAEKFAELVKEKTKGAVEISIFPNEQLSGGNQGKGVEMLRNGNTDISFHSNIIYSIMDERFGVVSLPWLMSNNEEVDAKLYNGKGGEALNKLLDEIGIVGLGFGENGFRQLTNSKQEVAKPEDIAGMKIRIPGIKMYVDLFQALGADPMSMNWAEVFTALQQKTIDGQENPIDTINSAKVQEVQKYLSMWNYSYDTIILGINKAKFDSLKPEYQEALKAAGKEACKFQIEANRSVEEEHLKKFEEAGVVVTHVTPENIEKFKEKVGSVYQKYEPIIGKELIDAFRN